MTWAQPFFSASLAFSSLPTVPMTVAPSAAAHWQASNPTPPAAAWKRIVARLDAKRAPEQATGRQALQKDCSRSLEVDLRRQFHGSCDVEQPGLTVAAQRGLVDDPVAGLEILDV